VQILPQLLARRTARFACERKRAAMAKPHDLNQMNKTELFDGEMNRYAFDFGHCRLNDGWAQLDTDQDASYFGNWAHPERLQIVSFVEGDITVIKCEDSDEFRNLI
jgi:hypothetical protein